MAHTRVAILKRCERLRRWKSFVLLTLAGKQRKDSLDAMVCSHDEPQMCCALEW
jgi:hypothetical protein